MSEVGEEDSAPESGEERLEAIVDENHEAEAQAEADMIVIDAVGELGDFMARDNWGADSDLGQRDNNDHEEICLSSDEEPDTAEGEDVSLLLLRRPAAIEPIQEAIDILDSDEEFPVYITEASKPENVNILEKKGRVAEYIEREGLGVIYAE